MPAPSRANCLACSYTVTSMPTLRSAAAVASPPMPAPMIATLRGFAIPIPVLRRSEACLFQCLAARLRRQRIQKSLHGRPLLARFHQREVIMLLGIGNETQPRCMRDRRNGHAPVGAMLRHGSRHRIVRARLVPVAVGTRAIEQAVNEDAGACPLVAVDHDAGWVRERSAHRAFRVQSLE